MTRNKSGKRKLSPGDAGYKTSSQLRNERKRRAKRKPKQEFTRPNADPSLLYISSPRKAPIVQKAAQFFRQQTGKDLCIFQGPDRGWRTVSKLAVRSVNQKCNNNLAIGLFQPKTHALIPGSGSCLVHHSSINKAVSQIESLACSYNVIPYDETTGRGDLRNIAIHVERSTGNVQVTLVWSGPAENKQQHDNALGFAAHLVSSMKKQLHSLWIHFNSSWKHDNAIISHSGSWECVHGPKQVVEYLEQETTSGGALPRVPLYFPPQVFRQANLDGFSKIVAKIRAVLISQKEKEESDKRHCVELYGGVGTIGLHVADLCASLTSSDENPYNQSCFHKSVESMKRRKEYSKVCISYESKNAEVMVASGCLDRADYVIVDPPRKGLDMTVVNGLCEAQRPRLLVYVSCGFDAFVRDCEILLKRGHWKLVEAEGHILFPGSDAIESLVFFRRDASTSR